MIKRELEGSLLNDAKKVPVIALLGPRQSGKTTLAKATFPNHRYVSLEDLDRREFASNDPRGFLKEYGNDPGVIIDEVQHVTSLLSYIQTRVDEERKPGKYILAGSQNFIMMEVISQSLAGRISILTLLPLSIIELRQAQLLPGKPEMLLFNGLYPRIYDENYNPNKFYADYIRTYVERDVRTMLKVANLATFQKFIRMCAGRIGQVVNLTSLGNDCGISYNTAKEWLSVLETSYIIFLLQPFHKNFNRRLITTPKMFFYDPGLACYLLNIENEKQVFTHYLRGGLFESMIISDLFKASFNRDLSPRLSFWRDYSKHEVDCIIERGQFAFPIETKAGSTLHKEFFESLIFWNSLSQADPSNGFVVYGGDEDQKRSAGTALSWKHLDKIQNHIDTVVK